MELEKRLLQQIVDALRIVAARAQEPTQLQFERDIEPIERLQIAALIRDHERLQRDVVPWVARAPRIPRMSGVHALRVYRHLPRTLWR
jgi:hypothetical protein